MSQSSSLNASSNIFQQQPVPMSLGTLQQQIAMTLSSLSSFQQQALPISVGMYQQQAVPMSVGMFHQQSLQSTYQQRTAPTSVIMSTYQQQLTPTTSLGALSFQQQGVDSLQFEQLQQSSSKQGPSVLEYSGNASSTQHTACSDLETLSNLHDIDDEYLSSSSSAINKSTEGHWKQPVFPSNQLQQNPSQGASHEESSLDCPSPLPFPSPAKLIPVSEVLKEHPGSDVASLRDLTIALARDSIFGRDELSHSSLSGRKNTATLDSKKMDYIKKVVYSRCPKKSLAEFEMIWGLCRTSLSKCCQTLRTHARRKL